MSGPLLLELFSGGGTVSAAARERGWRTVTVDIDHRNNPDHCRDVASFAWTGEQPALIWASPPCTEFSRESMPWCKTGTPPRLDLWHAVHRIVNDCRPEFWLIENVRGAQRWVGKAVNHAGPFYLWGWFPIGPRLLPLVEPCKEKKSGKNPLARAAIPKSLADAILANVEHALKTKQPADDSPAGDFPLFDVGAA